MICIEVFHGKLVRLQRGGGSVCAEITLANLPRIVKTCLSKTSFTKSFAKFLMAKFLSLALGREVTFFHSKHRKWKHHEFSTLLNAFWAKSSIEEYLGEWIWFFQISNYPRSWGNMNGKFWICSEQRKITLAMAWMVDQTQRPNCLETSVVQGGSLEQTSKQTRTQHSQVFEEHTSPTFMHLKRAMQMSNTDNKVTPRAAKL